MKFSTDKITKKEIIFSIIFFTCVIFGVLLGFGTITSGLHMVDDHEFWRFNVYLDEGQNLVDMIRERLKGDMSWRFRPLYYPIRLIVSAVFGTNLVLMSTLKGIETVFACVVVYFVARKLKCTPVYSVLTTFFVLAGSQSSIWWKLGPQELTCTWMFGLGILFLLIWRDNKKNIFNILSIIFVFIATLYKESYVALIPAVMLVYIYFEMEGKQVTWKNFWMAVKNNLVSEIALGLIILFDAYMILFVVGAGNVSYISADDSTTLWFYIKMFLNNFRLHLRVGQQGFYVIALVIIFRKELKCLISKLKWQFLLACVMVLPQFILYAKSGLEERYVVPWIYGVAYFFCAVLSKSELIKGQKRRLFNIALAVLTTVNFLLVFYEAAYFTYRGKGIAEMFDAVCEIATEDTKILSAYFPYDESETTCAIYLQSRGLTSVYAYRDGIGTDWWRVGEGTTISPEEADIILTYNYNDRHFVSEPDLDLSNYDITIFNTMRMAVKKE